MLCEKQKLVFKVDRVGTGAVRGWYAWLATRVCVERFLPLQTHPGNGGSGYNLLSTTLCD